MVETATSPLPCTVFDLRLRTQTQTLLTACVKCFFERRILHAFRVSPLTASHDGVAFVFAARHPESLSPPICTVSRLAVVKVTLRMLGVRVIGPPFDDHV